MELKIYSEGRRYGCFHLTTKSEVFLTDRVKVEVDLEKVVITRVGIDYLGKAYKPFRAKETHTVARIHVANDFLDVGVYPMDEEESDEDTIVCYFEDKTN